MRSTNITGRLPSREVAVAAWAAGLGYIRLPSEASAGAGLIVEGTAVMESVARACGYGLDEVFVDDGSGRWVGWGSLIDAVRVMRPVAVLVADIDGLRLPGSDLEMLRARLRRMTNAPLVLARFPVTSATPRYLDSGTPRVR